MTTEQYGDRMTVTPQEEVEVVEVHLLILIAVRLQVGWGPVPGELVQQLLPRLEEVVEALAVLVAVALADKENSNALQSL